MLKINLFYIDHVSQLQKLPYLPPSARPFPVPYCTVTSPVPSSASTFPSLFRRLPQWIFIQTDLPDRNLEHNCRPSAISKCNSTMAVRSRSSLHVRQDPDLNMLPPPSKRPRLEQQHFNPPALPSRHRHTRRGSSPDLLDTTIEPSSSSKPSSVRPANSPLSTTPLPPRASSRLLSSAHHARPSTPSNTLRTPSLQNRHDTPATTPVADPRESPDPLDTISPAPAISSQRIRPSPAVRETRQQHHHHQQHKTENTPGKPAESEKATRPNASRSSRRSSIPPPESQPAPGPSAGGSPIVRERKSLRSHDSGTRPRSELASYFPNYEQLLSLEPQKTGMLCANCAAPTIRIELTVS